MSTQTLVDSSVLLDVLAPSSWRAWSEERLADRGGERAAPLPDFFIGVHAAAAGLPLLTRDPRRIREYFPAVRLIAP